VRQDVAVYHFTVPGTAPPVYDTPTYEDTGSDPVDPSYIGLSCNDATVQLVFNIQMADHAPLAYARINRSQVDFYNIVDSPPSTAPGSGWVQEAGASVYSRATIVDTSYIYNAQPEDFQVLTQPLLASNHWHHLLLSFDLTGPVAVGQPNATSAAQLWYAIDDVDYRGASNLQPYRDVGDGLGDNAILTANIYTVSGGTSAPSLYENIYIPAASGTYQPVPVPAKEAELGVPASTLYKDFIYPVEMAELQFFTGVTLDTGEETNRRAFITKAGAPAPPGKRVIPPPPPPPIPVPPPPPPGPDDLLGKSPEILLHGSGNWITGKNTGKVIKLNEIGKPTAVPAEQLKPTGSIVSYSPDPSLHGAQSPPPPRPPLG
jgi:hypothetical protein